MWHIVVRRGQQPTEADRTTVLVIAATAAITSLAATVARVSAASPVPARASSRVSVAATAGMSSSAVSLREQTWAGHRQQ